MRGSGWLLGLAGGLFVSRPQPAHAEIQGETDHPVARVQLWRDTVGRPPFSVGGVHVDLGDDAWLRFHGFMQVRYLLNDHTAESSREQANGFNIARTRVFVEGRFAPWVSFLLRAGATSDGTLQVEQAYADLTWKELTLRVGQWYLPLFQEQVISPDATLTVNQSAVGGVFDGGQVLGARGLWMHDRLRLQVSTIDGLRTAFSEVGSPAKADFAVAGRAELIIGHPDFARFATGSSFRGERTAVLLGAAGHYQEGGQLNEGGTQVAIAAMDATLEGNGFNLHESVALARTKGADQSGQTNVGFVVQGGYFILPWTELYARYEALYVEADAQSELKNGLFRGATGGVNQYIWPARGMRLSGDFIYYFDGTQGTPIAANQNAGLFGSSSPQWAIRTQLNLIF